MLRWWVLVRCGLTNKTTSKESYFDKRCIRFGFWYPVRRCTIGATGFRGSLGAVQTDRAPVPIPIKATACQGLSSHRLQQLSFLLFALFSRICLQIPFARTCSEELVRRKGSSPSLYLLWPALSSFLQIHMASATACGSTAFAGQTLLKPVSELSRKVGTNEARVTMRKAASSSSIWFVCPLYSSSFHLHPS
jgi:hypothetical protein